MPIAAPIRREYLIGVYFHESTERDRTVSAPESAVRGRRLRGRGSTPGRHGPPVGVSGARSRVGEVVAKPHGRRSDENESREGDTAPQEERPVRIEVGAREADALERTPEHVVAPPNAAQSGRARGAWSVREVFNRLNGAPT